ncbi:Bcr/CflA family multidrug efflux MFS transporter [Roseiterribacter gracilis]|uniref:Bcr/CflA family efflux transporter n=1 Tax=Roseiterribacter gracilis TaxID=2812848 RepID=A0A8S8XDW7_9PROT|nr:Bcr/CflA family drug resistance efflux transporter [Rhodospirillales bacterium TMPK1]
MSTARPVSRLSLLLTLGALTAAAPLSVDMYLPSLPTLTQVFGVDAARAQLTLASFFIGFAGGQSIYGPLADRFGRKRPLMAGLLLFALASVGCALAPTIGVLIALRLVQAIGACAGGVISRAMVRDLFPPAEAANLFSSLMLVMGVAPLLAPLLGGWLLDLFGWASIFWLLAILGGAACIATFALLPETHQPDPSRPFALGSALRVYARLLSDRYFLAYALAGGLSMAGMFAYIAGVPFVLIDIYHVPPQQFGLFFAVNVIALIGAAQFNRLALKRLSQQQVIRRALFVQLLAGLTLFALGSTGTFGLYGIVVPLFVFAGSIGFVTPNSTTMAMAPYGRDAGSASALLGTIQFTLAAIMASTVGALEDHTARPMTIVIASCSIAGVICFAVLRPRSAIV